MSSPCAYGTFPGLAETRMSGIQAQHARSQCMPHQRHTEMLDMLEKKSTLSLANQLSATAPAAMWGLQISSGKLSSSGDRLILFSAAADVIA